MTDPGADEDLTTYPTPASVADVIEVNGPRRDADR